MKKLRISFSVLLALFLVSILSTAVFAEVGTVDNKGNEITHKTHGDYQNNTNSCASCHQTHTAQYSKLLFKNGTQATCTSCHDGTLGFYDVYAVGADHNNGAGTFGGDEVNGGASMHNSDETVKVSAAPGGNKSSTDSKTWGADFSCASCHSPHGSFSDRLLKVDPNGMASTPAAQGGNLQENVGVFAGSISAPVTDTDVPAGKNASAVLKYVSVAGTEYDDPTSPFYKDPNVKKGDRNALILYQKESANWVQGILLDQAIKGTTLTGAKYYPEKGYVTFTNALTPADVTASVAKPYIIKFDFDDDEAFVQKTTGVKSGDSRGFCLACHTDYKGGGSTQQTSKWDSNEKFYAHNTNDGTRKCLNCHFAHGTDVSIMMDALGNTVKDLVDEPTSPFYGNEELAKEYMVDKNASSALKKYTNMTSCWSCHNSSKAGQFLNSTRDSEHPHEFPAKW